MVDPFAPIDHECSEITASQEAVLRDDPFINDSQHSADATFLSSPSGGAARPQPFADAPILICSLRDTPASVAPRIGGGEDLRLGRGLRLASPEEKATGTSPAAEQRCPPGVQPSGGSPSLALPKGDPHGGAREDLGSTNRTKNARVSQRRSKGAQIRSSGSPPEASTVAVDDAGGGGGQEPSKQGHDQQSTRSKDEFERYRYQSLEVLKDAICNPSTASTSTAVPGPRKLPATIRNVPEGRITRTSSAAASSAEGPAFPANLLDVINAFSGKPNQRFADTDILEIALMKGIDFPPPHWWRPEGYDAKRRKATE